MGMGMGRGMGKGMDMGTSTSSMGSCTMGSQAATVAADGTATVAGWKEARFVPEAQDVLAAASGRRGGGGEAAADGGGLGARNGGEGATAAATSNGAPPPPTHGAPTVTVASEATGDACATAQAGSSPSPRRAPSGAALLTEARLLGLTAEEVPHTTPTTPTHQPANLPTCQAYQPTNLLTPAYSCLLTSSLTQAAYLAQPLDLGLGLDTGGPQPQHGPN